MIETIVVLLAYVLINRRPSSTILSVADFCCSSSQFQNLCSAAWSRRMRFVDSRIQSAGSCPVYFGWPRTFHFSVQETTHPL